MTLLPFDWGSAGWGTPAADLAQRGIAAGDEWNYWAHVDLATYAREVRPSWPRVDIAAVKRLSIAGKLFRTLVCVSLEAPSFAYDWVENAARDMGVYRASLDDAIRAATWAGGR